MHHLLFREHLIDSSFLSIFSLLGLKYAKFIWDTSKFSRAALKSIIHSIKILVIHTRSIVLLSSPTLLVVLVSWPNSRYSMQNLKRLANSYFNAVFLRVCLGNRFKKQFHFFCHITNFCTQSFLFKLAHLGSMKPA